MEIPLGKDRIVYLKSNIDNDSCNEITKLIIDVNEDDERLEVLYPVYGFKYNRKPIKLFIDSFGGSIYQGLGIVNLISASKTPVHTIVTGCAMSVASMISIAGHKRFAYKHSTFMFHQVSTFLFGTIQDLQEDLEETARLQLLLEKLILEKTKIKKSTLANIKKMKKNHFMISSEALKLGVIDEIL